MTIGTIKEALAATRLDLYNVLVRTRNADDTTQFEDSTLRETWTCTEGCASFPIISRVLHELLVPRSWGPLRKSGRSSTVSGDFVRTGQRGDAVLILRILCELFGALETRIGKLEEAQRRRLLKRTFCGRTTFHPPGGHAESISERRPQLSCASP